MAPRQRLQEPEAYAPRRVTLESEFVDQPSVSRTYLAPSFRTAEGNQAYALQVLDEILGGNNVGRLYRRLVVDKGLADYAGCNYDASPYDQGSFAFWGAPRQGVKVEEIEQAIDAEIADLLKNGVTDQEVADAKRRMEISAVKSRDSLERRARNSWRRGSRPAAPRRHPGLAGPDPASHRRRRAGRRQGGAGARTARSTGMLLPQARRRARRAAADPARADRRRHPMSRFRRIVFFVVLLLAPLPRGRSTSNP